MTFKSAFLYSPCTIIVTKGSGNGIVIFSAAASLNSTHNFSFTDDAAATVNASVSVDAAGNVSLAIDPCTLNDTNYTIVNLRVVPDKLATDPANPPIRLSAPSCSTAVFTGTPSGNYSFNGFSKLLGTNTPISYIGGSWIYDPTDLSSLPLPHNELSTFAFATPASSGLPINMAFRPEIDFITPAFWTDLTGSVVEELS